MHSSRLSPPSQKIYIPQKFSEEDQVAYPLLGCGAGKTTTLNAPGALQSLYILLGLRSTLFLLLPLPPCPCS